MWDLALLVILLVASFLDVWFTGIVLEEGGREANPFLRWVMEKVGRRLALALSFGLRAVIGVYAWWEELTFVLFVLAAVSVAAAAWNAIVRMEVEK